MKIPVVEQHDSSDCGVACVASICAYYGKEVTITKLRELLGTDAFGTTIRGISQGLGKLDFISRCIYIERESFENDEFTVPAIARFVRSDGTAHFVAVYSVKRKKVVYMDPAKDRVQKCSVDEFYKDFDGGMILMIPDENFIETKSQAKSVFSSFMSLVKPHWKFFVIAIGISVILTLFGILMSIFNKILIDEIIPYQERHQLMLFAIVLLIASFTQIILGAFRTHVLLYLSQKIDIPLMLGYFRHIFHLPMNFFASRKTGDIVTRFQDAGVVKDILTSTALSVIIDVSMIAIVGVFLYTTASSLFAITLAMALLSALLIHVFKSPYRKFNRKSMEQGARLNSQVIESISGIETIKTNSCETHVMENIETEFIKSLKISFKGGIMSNVQGSLSSALSTVGNLSILIVGGFLVIDNSLTLGSLMAFMSLSGYFIDPIERIIGLQLQIQEADISLKRLSEIYDVEEEDTIESSNDSGAIEDGIDSVRFENVSFRYGSRPLTLKHINMEINRGDKIALVGRSGCGKTTLSKLLLKFYLPEEGKILYNGVEIQGISAFALREKIGCVPQNVEVFSASIRENLLLGREGVSQGEIDYVCEISGCSEFIKKLPAGYDTLLDANGGGLSGGEKQRLAIARVLLRKPDLIIFDEATSNMDFVTEKKVMDLITAGLSGITMLIIAHRLSTIRKCDRIYVIDKGEVIESGTHNELMGNNGPYADMWHSQVGDDDSVSVKIKSDAVLCKKKEEKEKIKEVDKPGDVMEYGQ